MDEQHNQRFLKNMAALQRYCAYQERCSSEVRYKASKLGMNHDEIEDALTILQDENFLDDRRFAISFAQSKFRRNKWGKFKIRQGLFQKKIGESLMEEALNEINETEYRNTVIDLAKSKLAGLENKPPIEQRSLASRYLQQKGFEIPIIIECLNELIND